jgi:membrane associated rhomboid family serine protease
VASQTSQLSDADEQAESEDQGPAWAVPWHAWLPGWMLAAGLAIAFILYFFTGQMVSWGTSGQALREGRVYTLVTHMFAHGSIMHIAANLSALVPISATLIARLGEPPRAWLRFAAIYFFSGLAGAATYLAIHPAGHVPMLGASGAIYGLLGVLLRLTHEGDALVPMRSRAMWRATEEFVKDNLFLFVLLTLPHLLAGKEGGVAWEAHLGGILFGVLIAPYVLVPRPVEQDI